jgi:uncharacterized membrane protein
MLFGLVLLLVALAGFAITFVGYMGLLGKLPPNPWAGIRTSFTRASDENWYNTHRAAAPVMMFGGVLVLSIALAFMPFAFAGRLSDTISTIVVAVAGVLALMTAGLGWYAGTSYAAARAMHGGGGGDK